MLPLKKLLDVSIKLVIYCYSGSCMPNCQTNSVVVSNYLVNLLIFTWMVFTRSETDLLDQLRVNILFLKDS